MSGQCWAGSLLAPERLDKEQPPTYLWRKVSGWMEPVGLGLQMAGWSVQGLEEGHTLYIPGPCTASPWNRCTQHWQ